MRIALSGAGEKRIALAGSRVVNKVDFYGGSIKDSVLRRRGQG